MRLIENRRTPQGLDFFRRTLPISLEQEEVLRSPVHEKCNYTSPQFLEIDSVLNETIPEVARRDKLKNAAVKEHVLTFQKFLIVLVLSK